LTNPKSSVLWAAACRSLRAGRTAPMLGLSSWHAAREESYELADSLTFEIELDRNTIRGRRKVVHYLRVPPYA